MATKKKSGGGILDQIGGLLAGGGEAAVDVLDKTGLGKDELKNLTSPNTALQALSPAALPIVDIQQAENEKGQTAGVGRALSKAEKAAQDQSSGSSGKGKGKGKGGKGTTKQPTQAQIDAEAEKALQNNPITVAGNDLAAADQKAAQQAAAAMSPAGINAGIAQANAGAVADVGGGAGAQSWLAAQSAAAANNDSPLMAAMSAYQTAYENTQPAVNQALTNMGQANALSVAEAPYSDYLNLLTSHLGNANYLQLTGPQGATVAGNPALNYYLQQAGVSVPSSKTTAGIPSAGAILSGGTSTAPTPSALTPGAGPAPS